MLTSHVVSAFGVGEVASAQAAAEKANDTSSKAKAKRMRRAMRNLHRCVRAVRLGRPNMPVRTLRF